VEAHSKGFGVCVVDAAVMLKAGWDKHVHEIWVAITPEKEVCGHLALPTQEVSD